MNNKNSTHFIIGFMLVPLILLGYSGIGGNSIFQSVIAQTTEGTDSFTASGYTGQILTLPPSITQVPVSENESSVGPAVGSVIGGNWSLSVADGELENFTWNAVSYALNGNQDGTFAITEFRDAGPIGSTSDPIELDGNNTSFTGTADIQINNESAFTDVLTTFYILNGNIASLTISQGDTDGQFSLPLYGIVTSLTQ